MKTVVIGLGTVGRALASMLRRKHEVVVRDVEPGSPAQPVDVVNICFPYSDEFENAAVNYVHEYFPKAAIVHSTVPVGVTCVIPNARLLMATRFFAPADHLLEFNATLEEKEAPRYGERRQDAGKLPASQASPAFGD